MREATWMTRSLSRRLTVWLLCLASFGMVLAATVPASAAARRSSRARSKAARPASNVPLPGTIDERILLLQRSAEFWSSSAKAASVGVDDITAKVLATSCREQALRLKAGKAKAEGDRRLAARLLQAADRERQSLGGTNTGQMFVKPYTGRPMP